MESETMGVARQATDPTAHRHYVQIVSDSVCRSCNASKGARRLYEYWTLSKGCLKAAKYDVPRLAEGKCLKLLYELFDEADVLGVTEDDLHAHFCPRCDLGLVCEKEHSVGKLSPLCLDGVATVVLRGQV